MTATEIVRRLLDERGVEWSATVGANGTIWTHWDAFNGQRIHAMDNEDGTVEIFDQWNLTPAQAIAATLGCGTCKPMTYDNGYSIDRIEPGEYYEFWEPACACSECGELIPMRRFCPNCGHRIVEPTTNDVDAGVDDG